jgi:DNA-binding PadR family transcriptional regulator
MGLREGLLCLLAEGDTHGYELKTALESTTGDTWQVNVGQVYTTLQRLERDGLVVGAATTEGGRVVYALTDDGRLAAGQWLVAPVEPAAAGRDEITLKVMVAVRSGADVARRVIEVQRGSTMKLLQDYTTLKAGAEGKEMAWLLYLDRLILSAEAELRWLDRVEGRIEEMSPEPASSRKRKPAGLEVRS